MYHIKYIIIQVQPFVYLLAGIFIILCLSTHRSGLGSNDETSSTTSVLYFETLVDIIIIFLSKGEGTNKIFGTF